MTQEELGMEQLRQATADFVNLLSEISAKYEIESDDIQAMNSGLEKVWNSVTMSEDSAESLDEENEEVEEVPEMEEEIEEVE